MQGNLLPNVLLALAALLLVTSAAPAATTGAVDAYTGRVVINYASGTRMRRLEDEVAPELSSYGWAAGLSGRNDDISYNALNRNRGVCLAGSSCAANSGHGSKTRPCTYKDQCGQ